MFTFTQSNINCLNKDIMYYADETFKNFSFQNLKNKFYYYFNHYSEGNPKVYSTTELILISSLDENNVLQFKKLSETNQWLSFEVTCIKNASPLIAALPEKAVETFSLSAPIFDSTRMFHRDDYFIYSKLDLQEKDFIKILTEAFDQFFKGISPKTKLENELNEAVLASKARQEFKNDSSPHTPSSGNLNKTISSSRPKEPIGVTIFFIILFALALIGIMKLVGC